MRAPAHDALSVPRRVYLGSIRNTEPSAYAAKKCLTWASLRRVLSFILTPLELVHKMTLITVDCGYCMPAVAHNVQREI